MYDVWCTNKEEANELLYVGDFESPARLITANEIGCQREPDHKDDDSEHSKGCPDVSNLNGELGQLGLEDALLLLARDLLLSLLLSLLATLFVVALLGTFLSILVLVVLLTLLAVVCAVWCWLVVYWWGWRGVQQRLLLGACLEISTWANK